MDFGQITNEKRDSALMNLYQNQGYQEERTERKTVIIDSSMNADDNTFEVTLSEPLKIDKLSDIFLDSFVTTGEKTKGDMMAFVLKIDQFNINSIVGTNDNDADRTGIHNEGGIFIPNETSGDASTIHKGRKMNYVCSINPQKISKISGVLTNIASGSAFNDKADSDDDGRFLAEFVIIARD